MRVDKEYCMSSYLMFRFIYDDNILFADGKTRTKYKMAEYRHPCASADDIDKAIKYELGNVDKNTGILLSGGMDRAILATYLPEGANAYTLRILAEGIPDETALAKHYADICGLNHHIVDITWDDYQKFMPTILKHKKAPFHSIEPMIYKAALAAKDDGCTRLLCGENADIVFGGMDGLLSKDWTYDEFVQRYTYLDPRKVLKNPVFITEPFEEYMSEGVFDAHSFIGKYFYREAINSYFDATACAGIELVVPYHHMKMSVPIDLNRIRSGESKYLIRELFSMRYNNAKPAVKLPMPRGVGHWLENWDGPVREEFLLGCVSGLKGDQKWQLYCLERFLDMLDNGEIEGAGF